MAEGRINQLEEKLKRLALSSNEERERILKDHVAEAQSSQLPQGSPPSSGNEDDDEELLAQVSIDEEGKVRALAPCPGSSRFSR